MPLSSPRLTGRVAGPLGCVSIGRARLASASVATALAGLSPEMAADVLVEVELAKKGAGTVTVERGYPACS